MLEAVTKDLVFTISLKRSTQNLQLSTSWAGRLHHLLSRLGARSTDDTRPRSQTCATNSEPRKLQSLAT
jgi:hypothetical protein